MLTAIENEQMKKRKHRLRDYVLYFAISLAVAGMTVFLGLSHFDHDKIMKWAFFFFYTPVVFGFVVEQSRELWKLRSFWLLLGMFLLLHCIVLTVILSSKQHLQAVSFLPGFIEILFLVRVTRWLLSPTPSPR